jgi:hypothetical protein
MQPPAKGLFARLVPKKTSRCIGRWGAAKSGQQQEPHLGRAPKAMYGAELIRRKCQKAQPIDGQQIGLRPGPEFCWHGRSFKAWCQFHLWGIWLQRKFW